MARSILRARSRGLPEGPGHPVDLEGDALAWVMPQRLAANGDKEAALAKLQLRARHAARGRLAVTALGNEIFGRAVSILPERRLSVPLPSDGSAVRVSFSEAAD